MRALTRGVAVALVLLCGHGAWAASATRTSGFDYDPVTGLLTKEIVEPSDSNLCLVTVYQYDSYGNKYSATTRNCNGSSYAYGAYTEAAAPTGNAVIASRSSASAFAPGSVTINGTVYSYSAGQFATTSINALNHSETHTFDPRFGAVATLTGPNNLQTNWQYDGFGRKILETRADGTRTAWAYQFCSGFNGGTASCSRTGSVYVVITTPQNASGAQNGALTLVYFDMLNREVRSETQGMDSAAIYKDTYYDSLGRVRSVTPPYFASAPINCDSTPAACTTMTYDILGRVITQSVPVTTIAGTGTTTTTTTYNALTTTVMVSSTIAAMPEGVNQVKTTVKNSQGQVASVADTRGNTVIYRYDPFGNLLQTVNRDVSGAKPDVATTLAYDTRGRKTSMADPDMGNWTYVYNALGELKSQTDAKNQTITMSYDLLGRMTNRSEATIVSNWFYDTLDGTAGGTTCGTGTITSKGKLCKATSANSYSRQYSYDTLGRPSQIAVNIDTAYTIAYAYDANGRLATTTYPASPGYASGFQAKRVYQNGYLQQITDGANALIWRADSRTASGRVKNETLGNGLVTVRSFDSYDWLLSIGVGPTSTSLTIQSHGYSFDSIGNVVQRVDSINSVTENFSFDRLNRLLTASGTGSGGVGLTTRTWSYDALGGIATKSDAGTYTYNPTVTLPGGGTRTLPHAVASVTGTVNATYSYDANGNLTGGNGRTLTYTAFNLPNTISATLGGNSYSYTYNYSAEHERVRLDDVNPTGTNTTIYLHPDGAGRLLYEKEINPDTSTEHRHYIQADGQLVGVFVTKSVYATGETAGMRYFHTDHLGSIVRITNPSGASCDILAYEAFGSRRFPNGTPDPSGTIKGVCTPRGFTAHEHLDDIGLIHMNGRVYDPLLARFMTPDPNVQSPGNLQSYNRYSYVFNNPLGYTDPTGYLGHFFDFLGDNPVRTIVAIGAAVAVPALISEAFIGTAAAAATGGVGFGETAFATFGAAEGIVGGSLTGLGGALAGAAGGFSAGLIGSGGNFDAGLRGGISGGLFGFAGSVGAPDDFSRYAAHAGAGCITGAISGGGCGSGALSAVAGKLATNFSGDNPIAAVVAGGTASVIGGGKFANGAVTAAFGYLFNYCSGGKCKTALEQRLYDWWPGYKAGTLISNKLLGGGGESTAWEYVDAASVGLGVAGKGLQLLSDTILMPRVTVIGSAGDAALADAAAAGFNTFMGPVPTLIFEVNNSLGYGANSIWANFVRWRGDLVIDIGKEAAGKGLTLERGIFWGK